jgi:hypothetical protein
MKIEQTRNYFPEFQKKKFFKFLTEVSNLNILTKLPLNCEERVKNFVKRKLEIIEWVKDIDNQNSYLKFSDGFEEIDLGEKIIILQALIPFQVLTLDFLKQITFDYDMLLSDVQKHKMLDEKGPKEGVQWIKAVMQKREFIGDWERRIGKPWYWLAYFVYEIQFENEKMQSKI